MILRLRTRKLGEQKHHQKAGRQKKNENVNAARVTTQPPSKKKDNRQEAKVNNKINDTEVTDAPVPEDVINVLLQRFYRAGDIPVPNENIEQVELDHPVMRTENGEKSNKSKKPDKDKVTKMRKMDEIERVFGSHLQPRRRMKHGISIPNEEEQGTATLNSGGMTPEKSSKRKRGRPRKHVLNQDLPSGLSNTSSTPVLSSLPPAPRRSASHEHNFEGSGQMQNTAAAEPSSISSRKRKSGYRGIETLSEIADDTSGVKRVLEYDTQGQPVGPIGQTFSRYLGVLARKMVPVHHESWPKVPKELKEMLWNHLMAKYVIDPERRRTVLSTLGERWKTFKRNLTKDYIHPYKEQPELLKCPPEAYKFIKQEQWDAFVKTRLSEKFQATSKMLSERQTKIVYSHPQSQKSQSSGRSVDELDGCDNQKKAQQVEERGHVDETIDEPTNHNASGNLATEGENDALVTPEQSHPVTPTNSSYIPGQNSKQYSRRDSKQHSIELEKKVNQQAEKIIEMNQIVQELQTQFSGILPQGPTNTNNRKIISRDSQDAKNDHPFNLVSETYLQPVDKEKTKSDMPPPDVNTLGKGEKCSLAVDFKDNIVAHGLVFEKAELNEIIHNPPLGEDNVRVAVEYALSPNMLLPIPVIGEMTRVKDAIGSCVAWPKEFVLTKFEEEEPQGIEDKSGPIQAFASLIDEIVPTNNITIPIQHAIFDEEVDAHLHKADLTYLCNMQETSPSCINIYIKVLYDNLTTSQERFGFINPSFISSARGPSASSIITKRLQTAKSGTLLFVPYKTKEHWVLIVIDSSTMDVYWLDPLQKPPSIEIKIYITTGVKALQGDGKKRANPTWHQVKCPKQRTEGQCGYYVMKYIRELMEESTQPISEKILQFAKKNSYSQDELDDIRLELIDFILTYM